jgi:hypothetical protein
MGEPIQLKPITVLIGRNSAGKSTFARLFPLLRQSAERKKRSPILWFDEELVDFGTFSQAITRGESDIELILDLENLEDGRVRSRQTLLGDASNPNVIALKKAKVSMTLAEERESGATYAKEVRLDIAGTNVRLCMDAARWLQSLEIGTTRITWQPEKTRIKIEQGALLPRLRFIERPKAEKELWYVSRNPWRNYVNDYIHKYVHQNTSRGTTARIAAQIPLASGPEISAALKTIDGPPSWKSVRGATGTQFLKRLLENLIAANIDTLLEKLDDAASEAARGVRYLKPLRATAERYYRRVDLAVSEIDPEGRNLPMFLDSLNQLQLQSFRAWLQSNLDMDVEPQREGAQVLVMARAPGDTCASNVADMGFGVSQVLPIAAQLWASLQASRLSSSFPLSSFVVVEQPELHLHPAFQAKLADLFAGAVKNESNQVGRGANMPPPKIIVETHSQHIVNRLGLLVEAGRLQPEDVSIVLFEANETKPGTSKTRVSTFDAGGVLQNWPFGFFEPDL